MEQAVKGRKNLAALLSCGLLTVVIILPLLLVLTATLNQGIESFRAINLWIAEGNLDTLAEELAVARTGEATQLLQDEVEKLLAAVPDF